MKKVLVGLLSVVFTLSVQSASIWKVTKDNSTLYLGGTLHLLSTADYPLPAPYDLAFKNSDTLVFETDLQAMKTPSFQQQSIAMLTYQDGTTIESVLSEKTLARLTSHLESRGVPLIHIKPFKASLLSVTLSMIEMQRMGLTSQGVDEYFYMQGLQAQKKIDWFETPEEQLEFIAEMGVGEEDALINYTLDDITDLPEVINQLRTFWRNGDNEGMYNLGMKEFAKEYPKLFDSLLLQRNKNWMPKMRQFLSTPETEFVLVGAMHIPGKGGLLDMLEQLGYKIEQLN